jgi:type I restriction enzyme M protein
MNLKKTNAKTKVVEAIEAQIKEREKAAREEQNKADTVGASVFDLKAVNPNAVVTVDTRTPEQVIQSIEDQGRIVAKAMETLRELLRNRSGGHDIAWPSNRQRHKL